jgi:hypothetical protein
MSRGVNPDAAWSPCIWPQAARSGAAIACNGRAIARIQVSSERNTDITI